VGSFTASRTHFGFPPLLLPFPNGTPKCQAEPILFFSPQLSNQSFKRRQKSRSPLSFGNDIEILARFPSSSLPSFYTKKSNTYWVFFLLPPASPYPTTSPCCPLLFPIRPPIAFSINSTKFSSLMLSRYPPFIFPIPFAPRTELRRRMRRRSFAFVIAFFLTSEHNAIPFGRSPPSPPGRDSNQATFFPYSSSCSPPNSFLFQRNNLCHLLTRQSMSPSLLSLIFFLGCLAFTGWELS